MENNQEIIDSAELNMMSAISHLETELAKIRAGKANPIMLKGVSVEYYGNMTPLNQVASVSTPNAQTISIQPWEKDMLEEIEKSIINSNLGICIYKYYWRKALQKHINSNVIYNVCTWEYSYCIRIII